MFATKNSPLKREAPQSALLGPEKEIDESVVEVNEKDGSMSGIEVSPKKETTLVGKNLADQLPAIPSASSLTENKPPKKIALFANAIKPKVLVIHDIAIFRVEHGGTWRWEWSGRISF